MLASGIRMFQKNKSSHMLSGNYDLTNFLFPPEKRWYMHRIELAAFATSPLQCAFCSTAWGETKRPKLFSLLF
jgi:hypothetical protein